MNLIDKPGVSPIEATAQAIEMTALLSEGCEAAYETLHAAIPVALDAAMRAAGVTEWTIHRRGRVLRHRVAALDLELMRSVLETDPANMRWQEQVTPLLNTSTAAPETTGTSEPWCIVWDFRWPSR